MKNLCIRPRRSMLYMPGSNARALEKAKTLQADCYIFDLEDAVSPDAKLVAREQVIDAIRKGGYGKCECLVRVNALDSVWGYDDLAAVAQAGADGIVLPKVDGEQIVRQSQKVLLEHGWQPGREIWCMIETPLGVLHAQQIAASSPYLAGMIMGTSDLAKDLRCKHSFTRTAFLTSLELCILASRAYGLSIIDGVHLDLSDDDGFRASCEQGVELGFDGKTLIHPKTIDIANQIYSPSAEEIAEATKIITAFEQAAKEGKGVVVVNGRLIENLHVENAQRLLTIASAIEDMKV